MEFKKESWIDVTNGTMHYEDIIKSDKGKIFLHKVFNLIAKVSALDDFSLEPYIEIDSIFDTIDFKFKAKGILYNDDFPTKKAKENKMIEIEETLSNEGFDAVEAYYYGGDSKEVGDAGFDVEIKGFVELK